MHFKFLLHLFHAPNFDIIARARRSVHKDIVAHQLRIVFIGGYHIHLVILGFGLFGKRPNDIIGFVALFFDDRDVQSLEYFVDIGDSQTNRFGSFLAIGFIVGKEFGASYAPPLVESDRKVVGFFFFNHLEKGVHKAKNRRSVQSFGIDTRVLDKGVVAPKNKGISIEEEKAFFHFRCQVSGVRG